MGFETKFVKTPIIQGKIAYLCAVFSEYKNIPEDKLKTVLIGEIPEYLVDTVAHEISLLPVDTAIDLLARYRSTEAPSLETRVTEEVGFTTQETEIFKTGTYDLPVVLKSLYTIANPKQMPGDDSEETNTPLELVYSKPMPKQEKKPETLENRTINPEYTARKKMRYALRDLKPPQGLTKAENDIYFASIKSFEGTPAWNNMDVALGNKLAAANSAGILALERATSDGPYSFNQRFSPPQRFVEYKLVAEKEAEEKERRKKEFMDDPTNLPVLYNINLSTVNHLHCP